MIRAIRRVGMLALAASSLSGMYLLLQHGSAPGTDVTLSAGELAVVGPPEAQARQPVVPKTRVLLPHAAVANSALARDFPEQLAEVLEGTGFVKSPNGFTPRAPETNTARGAVEAAEAALSAREGLRLELPARGDGAALLSLPSGMAVDVREVGAEGEGRQVLGAVAYGRSGGMSYWRATDTGYEEWLLLAAAGEGPVARWEVRGGQLKQDGDDVVVADASRLSMLRVTAPKAYGPDGRQAVAWLRVEGNFVALYTTARGRALVDPLWTTSGSMTTARTNHTATVLEGGKVLVAGGTDGTSSLKSAELYDPTTGTWTPTAPMATARTNHTATVLTSGIVLVAGGSDGTTPLASAELYDPTTGTWTPTGPMATARTLHTATWVPPARVLVAGGNTNGSNASAELYDPATDSWSVVPPMTTARTGHTAQLLWDPWGCDDPLVLIAGGSDGNTVLASTEVYDTVTGMWSTSGLMATARTGHTATFLVSGDVLVAGGFDGNAALTSAELFDQGTSTWRSTGSMATARTGHTAVQLLAGEVVLVGQVLVAGGSDGKTTLASTELYEPLTETWSSTAPMATARAGHTANLLNPYGVLVAGGSDGNSALASGEVAAMLAISPPSVTLAPGGTQTFTATGGNGTGYTWTLALNNSGGTISSTGVYTAGATVGVYDAVQVTDCCNLTTTAGINVGPATIVLTVSPYNATLAPGGRQTFTASGGEFGTGYTWVLTANTSGGNITSTGNYTAGTTGGVDVIQAIDPRGDTGMAIATVTKGSVGCSATGGEAVPLLALAVLLATGRKRGTPRLTR